MAWAVAQLRGFDACRSQAASRSRKLKRDQFTVDIQAVGIQTQAAAGADGNHDEPREASGLTTKLVLTFVEREGGRPAVDAVLDRCGLSDREAELRDENRWVADRTRVCLFEAAAAVLDDPAVGRRIGAAAIDSNVGQALKLSLRALGSPRLIYSNVGRANAKFNRVHRMDVLEVGSHHARIRNVPLGGTPWSPCDCHYNIGLLSCAPLVFGAAPARVRHPRCIGEGDSECIYEVQWSAGERSATTLGLTLAALAALAVAALVAPALLPVAIVLGTVIALFAAIRSGIDRRRRWRLLRAQVSDQAEASDLLMASMQDLVSALQLDEVLSKITANAQAAVGGAEFALLAEEAGELHCRSSSDLHERTVSKLEAWAGSSAEVLRAPLLIDDLSRIPELADLRLHRSVPLGSLCAAPLVYRERTLGVLVALSSSGDGFLPRDLDVLSSYAAQAAIALTNATLYEAQQELAIQDPLTGLFNHRHFHETLERELELCRRHGGEMGLAVFDLDGFKQVNDTGGHAEGDEVLRRVAKALEGTCRRSDLAFRVGGDEFAVVLSNSGLRRTEAAAERAREAIASINERTSVSCGVASWPQAGPTKDALLARADSSLYEMKRRIETDPATRGPAGNGAVATGKHERLASASRIAVKLAPLLEEAEIARVAIAELQESLGYRRSAVYRLEGSALLPIAGGGDGAGYLGLPSEASRESAPARAARSGEAVRINESAVGSNGSGGASASLATPIRVDGETWGVLELVHEGPEGFGFDDVLFADTIASAVGAAIHRGQLYAELEGTFMRTIAVLSDALEAKDPYTAAHAREVADLADQVARSLELDSNERRTLSYGALLHDIGKIAIRSEILRKPEPLTAEEYEEMKEHTVVGARMLERIPYFAHVHPLVCSSHERWDGAGYPDGKAGTEIPLGSRIISACDAFHAMTTDRPYREAMGRDDAVAELVRQAGTQFDPAVIDALVDVLGERTTVVDELPVEVTTPATG